MSWPNSDAAIGPIPIDVQRNGVNQQKIVLPPSVIGEGGFELELGKLKDKHARLFDVMSAPTLNSQNLKWKF